MVSKACIVGIYQRKLEAIAREGIDLQVIVPPSWHDERGETKLERVYTEGYQLEVLPMRFNGNFHLHYYVGLGAKIRAFQPQIVHIDEEPYNVATWQSLIHAQRIGAKSLFFSWQNIYRDYPIPFRQGESWVLKTIDYALVGTESAGEVWRQKGYQGGMAVIPQFGTDTNLFQPSAASMNRPFTIGYFGRLVEEKGIPTLLDAVTGLQGDWRLRILGGGPMLTALQHQVQVNQIADKVEFIAHVGSIEMPAQYHTLDAFVLPSLTRPNWKEQFGRVLIEAMASGVPVIGSNSGAIPDVIGDAGLIFPEGHADALCQQLRLLEANPAYRAELAAKGRARAVAHFTHDQVARDTVAIYRKMMAEA
jgi:glycosyltransferase involved in cell wall biosynthesis